MKTVFDKIIFSPSDVNLKYSPLRKNINLDTYVLGAFNPGMTKLPNNNLLLMVRIAEVLKENKTKKCYRFLRWTKNKGYVIDEIPAEMLDTSDPRKYMILGKPNKTYSLTSSSWLLPVELNSTGEGIVKIHYDKIIFPQEDYQEYGIEDARITKIKEIYYMTACAVSSSRHSTILYSSKDGLNYKLKGEILDHQNKDMVLFPKKIGKYYYALTRPTGDHYFSTNFDSINISGPAINMAQSPDLLHWKPVENFSIQAMRNSLLSFKIGGGAPPIETKHGWLVLFHGVEQKGEIGIYRTFKCILHKKQPWKILSIDYLNPILESDPALTKNLASSVYVKNITFTTGIEKHKDNYIIASGELDLCCRISQINKKYFGIN